MAFSAIPKSEITEYFDSHEELEKKVKKLANMFRKSKYTVIYTGAGISTSAGIPDFRGPQGVWTLKAEGKSPPKSIPREQVIPTFCHQSIVSLMKNGYIKHVVSQNCDGLHLKSGIPPENISELHGNCFIEACPDCGLVYLRDYHIRLPNTRPRSRETGRFCDKCKGKLRYTVVAFGQSLPDLCFEKATIESEKSELSICMGTSMRVKPACKLPMKSSGKKVIINLQETPYDDRCDLRIFARTDQVMTLLTKELGVSVEPYVNDSLTKDKEYMSNFSTKYLFRRPSHDWFDDNC